MTPCYGPPKGGNTGEEPQNYRQWGEVVRAVPSGSNSQNSSESFIFTTTAPAKREPFFSPFMQKI